MKTYFVCSDIHGYYNEWMSSLNDAGFDKDNKDHILVVLGDIFDRGRKPWEIYQFIVSLPEERVVLVKGNHEYLLLELVRRKYPFDNDYYNGTYQTLMDLLGFDPEKERYEWIQNNRHLYKDDFILYEDSYALLRKNNERLYDNDKLNEIIDWINSSRWRNYFELGKYIFVHSFIPLKGINDIYRVGYKGEYSQHWREEKEPKMWEMATWGCPYQYYLWGCFDEEIKKGKTIVCGHWHTSDFYNKLLYASEPSKQLKMKKSNPIFKSDKYPGLIAIDACTAFTKEVNVLIIKENEL